MKPREGTQVYRSIKEEIATLVKELDTLYNENKDKCTDWKNNISPKLQYKIKQFVQWSEKSDAEKGITRVFTPQAKTVENAEDILLTLKDKQRLMTTEIENHGLKEQVEVAKEAINTDQTAVYAADVSANNTLAHAEQTCKAAASTSNAVKGANIVLTNAANTMSSLKSKTSHVETLDKKRGQSTSASASV